MATANDIIEALNIVGQEIIALKMLNSIQSSKGKSENIELLENTYLNKIIENMDEMNLEEKSIKNGLSLIELHLQNQELITPKMIEFYLQYRVKKLNLRSICEDIIVTLGNNKRPAFYTLEGDINKNGTLKIYYEYVIKVLEKYKGQIEEKNGMI